MLSKRWLKLMVCSLPFPWSCESLFSSPILRVVCEYVCSLDAMRVKCSKVGVRQRAESLRVCSILFCSILFRELHVCFKFRNCISSCSSTSSSIFFASTINLNHREMNFVSAEHQQYMRSSTAIDVLFVVDLSWLPPSKNTKSKVRVTKPVFDHIKCSKHGVRAML